MRINLLCIGKTDDAEIRKLIAYYQQRLPRHWNFSIQELPDLKNAKNYTPDHLKKEEAKLFLQHLEPSDYIILLDEHGQEYSSRGFSQRMAFWMNSSLKRLCFLIGGASGFSSEIHQKAHEKISLSKMTFTHQMVRLFFIEQMYRAEQILQGKPYHND